MRGPVLLGFGVLATSCATKPLPHGCTLIGCLAPASFDVIAGADAASLTGAKVTICRNGGCAYDVRGGIFPTDGLADGDVYTVVLKTSGGTVLASKGWTATYTAEYPNGPDCNACLYATLKPQN